MRSKKKRSQNSEEERRRDSGKKKKRLVSRNFTFCACGSEGRVWLNLFVCFSRIINEISIGSSLGRKGRDDFRYVACCRYQYRKHSVFPWVWAQCCQSAVHQALVTRSRRKLWITHCCDQSRWPYEHFSAGDSSFEAAEASDEKPFPVLLWMWALHWDSFVSMHAV